MILRKKNIHKKVGCNVYFMFVQELEWDQIICPL